MSKDVFIGFSNIAGYYSRLVPELRKLGYGIRYVDLTYNKFQYDDQSENNWYISMYRRILKKSISSTKLLYTILALILRIAYKWMIFIPVVCRYDVFIFPYLDSFFWGYEIRLFKILNKRVIFVCHGTDSRPPYLDGTIINHTNSNNLIFKKTKRKKALIKRFEKGGVFIDNAAQACLHGEPFIKWLCVGIPYEVNKRNDEVPKEENSSIKILHSPSDPHAKGTSIIISLINELRDEGYNIELKIVKNAQHSEVINQILLSDLVFDQVWSDTPLAGFAAEAAFHGVPALVGGYYNDHVEYDHNQHNIPPSFYCDPLDLKSTLKHIVENPEILHEKGKDALKFVKDNWNSQVVAHKFDQIIKDEIPEEWWFDPQKQQQLYPCCISKEKAELVMKNLIESYGTKSLRLTDKNHLISQYQLI